MSVPHPSFYTITGLSYSHEGWLVVSVVSQANLTHMPWVFQLWGQQQYMLNGLYTLGT